MMEKMAEMEDTQGLSRLRVVNSFHGKNQNNYNRDEELDTTDK